MHIGILSIIPWKFMKQRPHELAEGLARLGHTVYYFERTRWNKGLFRNMHTLVHSLHPIPLGNRLFLMRPVLVPPYRHTESALKYNRLFLPIIAQVFKKLLLDFLIVQETEYADAVLASGVPFAYDHIDDTQFMDCVLTERYLQNMEELKRYSAFNIYIHQPAASRDPKGVCLPNGVADREFHPLAVDKSFDAVVLSSIARWFDMDSILESRKGIVLIGPMDIDGGDNYRRFNSNRKSSLLYVPEIERRMAVHWLNRARVGLVPFKETHPVVRYAMPLKILEYFLCDLPVVTYRNEGIEYHYGNRVTFYSRNGQGLPLDEAIEEAMARKPPDLREFALQFRWSEMVRRLDERIRVQ